VSLLRSNVCRSRRVSEGVGKVGGVEKVIREDGGSSCNGLRRQASRLMEPCFSRKALSIRAASVDAVGLRHSKSAASPVVISARAGAKDRRAQI